MRKALLIAMSAAVSLALTGCSSTEEPKKEAAAPEPKKEAAKEQAPQIYKVDFDTSKGPIVVEVHRDWAPLGADHFYLLVKLGFYDDVRFFRYSRRFIVQFGINGNPQVNARWSNINLPDDPVKQSNTRGTLTYATAGPRTRSTQLFFNLGNNAALDAQGFSPFAKVVSGMDVVEGLYSGYGEIPDMGGQGPDPGKIEIQGNEYLTSHFPRLDYIKKATIE